MVAATRGEAKTGFVIESYEQRNDEEVRMGLFFRYWVIRLFRYWVLVGIDTFIADFKLQVISRALCRALGKRQQAVTSQSCYSCCASAFFPLLYVQQVVIVTECSSCPEKYTIDAASRHWLLLSFTLKRVVPSGEGQRTRFAARTSPFPD